MVKKIIFCLFFIGVYQLEAQDTLVVSSKVGKVIDAMEKSSFKLFPYYKEESFQRAVILEMPDKAIVLQSVISGSIVNKPLSLSEYEEIRNLVEGITGKAGSQEKKLILMYNGAEHIGKILSDDGREILIETEKTGKLYLYKSDVKLIKSIESESELTDGKYSFEGPITTRYAFTNNALPIRRNENYSMMNLYGPEVHFAVTDNLNIGIMSTWIASPVVLALKYTFKKKPSNVNFSIGTLMGSSGYLYNFRGYGGLHWLSMTVGDRRNNITISGGYGYMMPGSKNKAYVPKEGTYYNEVPNFETTRAKMNQGPIASIAGITKVGQKASFFVDAMFFMYNRFYIRQELVDLSYTSNGIWYTNYKVTVTHHTAQAMALMVMPGFRFQSADNRAFQFALAGLSIWGEGKDNMNLPIPMCSWFRTF